MAAQRWVNGSARVGTPAADGVVIGSADEPLAARREGDRAQVVRMPMENQRLVRTLALAEQDVVVEASPGHQLFVWGEGERVGDPIELRYLSGRNQIPEPGRFRPAGRIHLLTRQRQQTV